MSKYMGTAVKRVEDPRFLQGHGRYVANLALPGMVHVAVKRSPLAHAKINGIDTSEAEALDGVIAVFTGQDLVDGGCGTLWLDTTQHHDARPLPGVHRQGPPRRR